MQEAQNKLPLLSDEETKALIARAQAGDSWARDRLVNCNLRLVRSLIGRFKHRQVEMEDLYQLGCIGLIRAIDRFDLNQNVRFSTYAVPLILGEIRRYLRDNGPIKVSRSLKELAAKANQERESLSRTLGREVTIEELAAQLRVEPEMLLMAQEATSTPASLQSEIYQDDGNPIYLMDHLTDENEPETTWTDNIALKSVIAELTPREQQIIKMRYFQGKTQSEIAERLHVSQVQISRLEKRILQKLKATLQEP
ncbi:MAG: RNA polymerase sporulation sigma factor, SigF/SigG family [Firmicutes bacterium]|nr:RNA polymerase sporulation sigma factor, SigF/SigG family [Bacillota bacterium]